MALSNKIVEEAMFLPSNERLALIESLIQSLNLPTQAEVDKIWAVEAEKRIKELDEGIVKEISGDEVIKEVRERYKNEIHFSSRGKNRTQQNC